MYYRVYYNRCSLFWKIISTDASDTVLGTQQEVIQQKKVNEPKKKMAKPCHTRMWIMLALGVAAEMHRAYLFCKLPARKQERNTQYTFVSGGVLHHLYINLFFLFCKMHTCTVYTILFICIYEPLMCMIFVGTILVVV